MATIDFGSAMRSARASNPAPIPAILAAAAAGVPATDLVIYLVDFGQTTLEPLPDGAPHAELPVTENVATTMAGRSFIEQRVISAPRDGGVRVWAPMLEGSDRRGVVAITVPAFDDRVGRDAEDLGLLAGYLIAADARSTDLYHLYRRRRRMSLAASMQWALLPPLVMNRGPLAVAGLLEPAYDVGGDCFDYAANGQVFDLAVMDAMGHSVGAAVISALAMGCYRHGRREGRALTAMHSDLASTMEAQFPDKSFATGVLGRIDTASGAFTWTNAGHLLPLLVRDGRVIGQLACKPTPPWGVGGGGEPMTATEHLEPGDSLLLYTDGVTEARTPAGETFGVDRLIDLTERSASNLLSPEATVRHLIDSVREHRRDDLADDATVVMVRWHGPAEP